MGALQQRIRNDGAAVIGRLYRGQEFLVEVRSDNRAEVQRLLEAEAARARAAYVPNNVTSARSRRRKRCTA